MDMNFLLSIFAAIAMAMAEVIGKLVIAVLDIAIPVMQYQGFTSSPVVNTGWAIVRDVVNMFFVVILIILAMQTIFGSAKAEWRQQVPKIMVMAIVINFSKTLCGIMIDFAQVIMLTFANALKDIAGGNFIQMLGLGDIFSLSAKSSQVAGAAAGTNTTGTSAFDLFAAGVAAVVMMVWVLAVVMILLCVLVYRVVMLWILIVMAPLAWFTKIVPFDQAKGSYSEWWKNFICYCSIGPVLTFFLWLTLAVAGSGFIASQDTGFTQVGQAQDGAAGFITEIFEWQSLLSFVIGMAMLMAGMDAAAKVCEGAKGGVGKLIAQTKGGGFINQAIGGQARKYGDKGTKWAGGKVKAGGAALAGGAGGLALGAGAAGLAIAGTKMATGKADWTAIAPTASGKAARAQGMRELSKGKYVPTLLSQKLNKAADSRQQEVSADMKKATEEQFKGASAETELAALQSMADGTVPIGQMQAHRGLLAKALKDPKMREKMEASGILGKLVKSELPELKNQLKGTKEYESIEDFEAGRPDLTEKIGSINSFEDLQKIDPAALAAISSDPAMRAQFEKNIADKKIVSTTYDGKGGVLDAKQWLEGGHGGGKRTKAWADGKAGYYENLSAANLGLVPAANLAANLTPALIAKRPDAAAAAMASKNPVVRARLASNPDTYKAAAKSALGISYGSTGVPTADPAKLKAALKKDVNMLGNVPTADIEGNAVFAKNIADSIDKDQLKQMLSSYKAATPDERIAMDATVVENALEALEQSVFSRTASLPEVVEYKKLGRNLTTQIEGMNGGTMGSTVLGLNQQITTLNANLATERAKSSPDAATITRLTEDVRKMTKRRERHINQKWT